MRIGDRVKGRVLYIETGIYERHYVWRGMLLSMDNNFCGPICVLCWQIDDVSRTPCMEVQKYEKGISAADGETGAIKESLRTIARWQQELPRIVGIWVEGQKNGRKERAEISDIPPV